MSKYFKKFKEAIEQPTTPTTFSTPRPQSFGIVEDIRRIGDIPNQIRQLRAEITELKKWKDSDAIPKISKSLSSIESINTNITSKILPEIKNIHNDISGNLLPKINEGLTRSLDASNIAVFARDAAELAKNQAVSSAQLVEKFYGMFTEVGDGLMIDMKTVITAEQKLMETTKYEMKRIKSVFTDFGLEIKDRSTGVALSMKGLATQLTDAVVEIKKPFDRVLYHGQRIAPIKLDRIVSSVKNAYSSLAYLIWRGYEGENSVLLEVMEAFNQISRSSSRLRNDFDYFGSGVSKQSEDISLQLSKSISSIQIALYNFIYSIETVFINMSARLQTTAEKSQQILSQKAQREQERIAEFSSIQDSLKSDYIYNIKIQEDRVSKASTDVQTAISEYNNAVAYQKNRADRLKYIDGRMRQIEEAISSSGFSGFLGVL